MPKELLAKIVNEQQMEIYAEETAKLQAENKDYQLLKDEYPKVIEAMLWAIKERPDLTKP